MDSRPAETDDRSYHDLETEYRHSDDDKALIKALTLHDKPCMSY